MTASAARPPRVLDAASRTWLRQLRRQGPVREAAIGRLYALLLKEARHEVRRRTAGLAHPSGRDLDDLAIQAADDALVGILAKLDQFRGEAQFTTWARRFATIEVPGEIRRRLGHGHEAPIDPEQWPPDQVASEDPEQLVEARELARAVGYVIASDLTVRQREVLVSLTIEETSAKALANRMDSTPGAVYKTLHDARRKLRAGLASGRADRARTPAAHNGRGPLLPRGLRRAVKASATDIRAQPNTRGGAPLR